MAVTGLGVSMKASQDRLRLDVASHRENRCRLFFDGLNRLFLWEHVRIRTNGSRVTIQEGGVGMESTVDENRKRRKDIVQDLVGGLTCAVANQ